MRLPHGQRTRSIHTRRFSIRLTWTNMWPQPVGLELKIRISPNRA